MDWTGVPDALLRAARFEWKIQHANDDTTDDVPLAVALDSAKDPTNIMGQWYIYVARSRKFHVCNDLRIVKEVFAKAEVSHFHKALVTWAHKRSSLQGCAASGTQGENWPSVTLTRAHTYIYIYIYIYK